MGVEQTKTSDPRILTEDQWAIRLQPVRIGLVESLMASGYGALADGLEAAGINMRDRVMFRFTSYLAAVGKETQTVRYPADWWSAFKLRFFPAWALFRWPPEYVTEIFQTYKAVCPHTSLELSKHRNRGECLLWLFERQHD